MAEEKQEIKINLDPNAYAITMVNMGFDEELFHFLITSSNQARQFLATPKHAKRIYLLLKQEIEQYEKKFGELKTELPPKPKTTQKEEKVGF
ncbi:DUF3467 domain-containing protein [Patescibacteria group bacterium]